MTAIHRLAGSRAVAPALERAAAAALTLLAVAFALESTRPLAALGPLVLTNVEALLFLTIGLWAAACLAARRRPAIPRTVALPAVAWLAALALSALFAPAHRLDAAKFTGRMAGALLIAWAAYDLSSSAPRRATLTRALAAGGLLVGLLGLAEATRLPAVTQFLSAFKEAPTAVGEVLRVSSTLPYATIASMVLELTVPLLLAWVITVERRLTRALLAAGLLVTLAAQALTLTRGGLLALLAALATMAAWAGWRHQRALLTGSLAAGAALLACWAMILIWNPVARYRLVSETEQRWYQAAYQAPPRLAVEANETLRVPVTLTNTGARTWHAQGDHAFALGYHLYRPDGTLVTFDGGRVALPYDVPPGATVEVLAPVTAPAAGGAYVIEWDVLQEGITWFAWEGAPAGRTQLAVAATSAAPSGALPLPGAPAPPPPAALTAGEEGRLWLWQVAARMFAESPLLGVGPDNFRWLHAAHAGVEQADTRVHANNLYVEWLVDTGIVGFAAFAWLTLALARTAALSVQIHPWRRRHSTHNNLSLRASAASEAIPTYDHGRDCFGTQRVPQTTGPRNDTFLVASASEQINLIAVVAALVAWYTHGALDFFYEFTPTYVAFALLCGLLLAHAVPRANPVAEAANPLCHQGGTPCALDST